MATVFHVDRPGQLTAGQTLTLERMLPVRPGVGPDLLAMATLDRLFPAGISRFGAFQTISQVPWPDTGQTNPEPIIEVIWEAVRRDFYPDRPSRLVSLYAFPDIAAAEQFRDDRAPGSAIYEIAVADDHFRGDQEQLDLSDTGLDILAHALRYWDGAPTNNPIWEILVPLPTTIGPAVGA